MLEVRMSRDCWQKRVVKKIKRICEDAGLCYHDDGWGIKTIHRKEVQTVQKRYIFGRKNVEKTVNKTIGRVSFIPDKKFVFLSGKKSDLIDIAQQLSDLNIDVTLFNEDCSDYEFKVE